MIRFFCAGCGREIALQSVPEGGRAICPICNQVVPVPAAVAAAYSPASSLRWEGAKMIVPRGAVLPHGNCALCGRSEGVTQISKTFTWLNPLAYLGLLGGLIPLVILALILQKRESLPVPLCGRCARSWSLSAILFPLGIILGLFALPAVGGIVGNAVNPSDGAAIGAGLGILVWIVGLFVGRYVWVSRTQLIVRKIDAAAITLQHPDPAMIQRTWGMMG